MPSIHTHHSYGTYIQMGTASLLGIEDNPNSNILRNDKSCRYAAMQLYHTLECHTAKGWKSAFYKISQVFRWVFLFGQTDWKKTRQELVKVSRTRLEGKLTKKLLDAFGKALDKPILPNSPEEKEVQKYDPCGTIFKSGKNYLNFEWENNPDVFHNYFTVRDRCRQLARSMLQTIPFERYVEDAMQDFLKINQFVEKKSSKLFDYDGTARPTVEIKYKNKYFNSKEAWKSFFMKRVSKEYSPMELEGYNTRNIRWLTDQGKPFVVNCQPRPYKSNFHLKVLKEHQKKMVEVMAKCLGFRHVVYMPTVLINAISR